MARSLRRNGKWEFSARLFAHLAVSCLSSIPMIFMVARYEANRSVTMTSGLSYRFMALRKKIQCSLAISAFRNAAFQNFALMINRAPQIMLLAIDLDEDLIELPSPLRTLAHGLRSLLTDLRRKHRTKSVPPVTHAFMADVDAAFVD